MIDQQMQQVLRERYNPEGSTKRSLQLEELKLLEQFHTLCEKHKIPYWLDSGTLIGAVRHGGFIPWDDDIDVCVLLKDYKRLRKVLMEELNAPYTFQDCETDKAYYHKWAQIVNTDIVVERYIPQQEKVIRKYLWIDILPVEEGCVRLKKEVEKLYGRCYRRVSGQIMDNNVNKCIAQLLMPILTGVITLQRCINRVFFRNTYIHRYGVEFYSVRKKKDVFPLSVIEFEGKKFYAPHNTHNYLTRIFRDYDTLPSEENREAHGVIDRKRESRV